MAEQWGCPGDKSVCFYLSDIHDIWCSSYEDIDNIGYAYGVTRL